MRYTAEPAYVLHARPWRETSLLVEVLSAAHGRLGLVARGVRGPKRQQLRAALQPWQHIRFDAVQLGELARLSTAEAVDTAPRLGGEAMLAAFYINELVLRLAPRSDPQPQLFAAYARARARVGVDESLAWTMRRFERDLLEALGVGMDLVRDSQGALLDPAARYRLEAEHGLQRLRSDRGSVDRRSAASGRALQALAADRQPDPADLVGLRHALRPVLLHHLGGRGLNSWELLSALKRL